MVRAGNNTFAEQHCRAAEAFDANSRIFSSGAATILNFIVDGTSAVSFFAMRPEASRRVAVSSTTRYSVNNFLRVFSAYSMLLRRGVTWDPLAESLARPLFLRHGSG